MKTMLIALAMLAMTGSAGAHEPPAWRLSTQEVCFSGNCSVYGMSRIRYADERNCVFGESELARAWALATYREEPMAHRLRTLEADLKSGKLVINVVCEQVPPMR